MMFDVQEMNITPLEGKVLELGVVIAIQRKRTKEMIIFKRLLVLAVVCAAALGVSACDDDKKSDANAFVIGNDG